MVFQLEDQITDLINPVLKEMGYELIRVRFVSGNNPVLQIMAEKPDGIMGVDDCSKVSREVSALLDVEDQISGRYVLEVSSPGIDRPLTRLKDYEHYKGFDAKLELKFSSDGQRNVKGVLGGIEENTIILQTDDEDWKIPFEDIKKAKLILTNELIKFAGKVESVSED